MEVHWTSAAEAELDAIARWYARRSERRAVEFVARVTARTAQLRDYPFSGRMVPEYGYPQVRELIEGNYRLLYHVLPYRGEVLGIINSAQDLSGTS